MVPSHPLPRYSRRVPELVSLVPAVALAVYAHPDDAEVACGGTLALWASQGSEVHVVVITSGDKGAADGNAEGLVQRRAEEMAEASRVLGLAGRITLGYPDGEVGDTLSLREELVRLVRTIKPHVVVCPDPTAAFFGQEYVNHRDHRAAGWCAVDAVAPAAALPLYFPAAGPPHQVEMLFLSGTLFPDIAVDVSETLERKVAALQCHRSQVGASPEWVESMVRRRAEEAGGTAGVRFAETFRRQHLAG